MAYKNSYENLHNIILEIVQHAQRLGYLDYVEVFDDHNNLITKYIPSSFVISKDVFDKLMDIHILENPKDYFSQDRAYFQNIHGISYRVNQQKPKGTINLIDGYGKDLIVSNVFNEEVRII